MFNSNPKYRIVFEIENTNLTKAGLESIMKNSVRRGLSPPFYDERVEEGKAVITRLEIEEINA